MAHYWAKRFANLHADRPHKAVQVYRNTLAVCVVYDYLSQQGFEANLEQSDCWNPVEQALSDVADLHLTGLGNVECCPVLPTADRLEISEFWDDRLAYVVTQLDQDQAEATQATILGFVTQPEQDTITLKALRSPSELIQLLTPKSPVLAHLSQWLDNIFDAGWETIDTILNPNGDFYAYAFRDQNNPIRRAKLLDFGLHLQGISVALLVGLEPRPNSKVWVRVQLHPVGTATHLPANLALTLRTHSGESIQQVISQSNNFMIQLQGFTLPVGRQFQVQVSYNDASVIERFVV
jgi:hypothetical protein